MFCAYGFADDTAELKEQVKALQEKVDQLESQLAGRQQASAPMAMTGYNQWADPFTQMMMIQKQMDRNMRQTIAANGAFNPKMDLNQTDKQYVITMDLPGMDKDKIDIEVKDRMLVISGERKSEAEDNRPNQYYRQELSFGSFTQAVPLPEDAVVDKIDAKYNNGVLTVIFPREKKEEKNLASQKIMVK